MTIHYGHFELIQIVYSMELSKNFKKNNKIITLKMSYHISKSVYYIIRMGQQIVWFRLQFKYL